MIKKLLCFVIFFLLALAVLDSAGAESRKKYFSIEEKIEAEGSANVIIRLSTQAEQKAVKNSISTVAKDSLKNGRELKIINAYSGELTKRGLKDLKKIEQQGYRVEIYEDVVFQLYAKKDGKEIRTALDNSIVSIGANYSREILNITGRNITVAVIDSGIDYNHTDLGGCFGTGCRVKNGYDFENNDSDPYDDYGHGTHVAGIIGANGTVKGVAPNVEFLAIKSCDSFGNCNLSKIIEGIEWATNNGADIISMSLGGSYSSTIYGNTGKDSASLAAEAAINSGKIVVIAGGNHGPGVNTIAIPGAAENVITVGNIDDKGTQTQSDDTIASSSSRGPSAFGRLDPDIVAPGELIYSTYLNNNYQTMSGTSMATPHVAGVAALLLEKNKTLTPAEIRRIIMSSAVNVSGKVFEVGVGEVNAKNALLFNLSAIIDARNSYNFSVSNDRWEFISPINGTEHANVTIYNNNNYDINFTLIITPFENMENSQTLDVSQLSFPQSIIVSANDNYTLEINFTVNNFSNLYPTTYGGKLMLIGNDSKNMSIPIVITVPIKNYANIVKTLTHSGENDGDVFYYAYYNPKPGNETITISWNSTSNDLDLYVYNSTGDIYNYGGYINTNYESINTLLNNNLIWFRVHGYEFTPSPFNFTINITDNGNIAPNITNITNAEGIADFNFSLSENITLNFYFTNTDNDSLTFIFNDTRYTQESLYENNVTYTLTTNSSLVGEHYVRLTITDDYGATVYRDITVGVFDVQITSFYPTNLTPIVKKNSTINFTQTSTDSLGNSLEYYWYIDGVLNSTSENLTINTTNMPNDNYNITFRVTNNITNATKAWNLTIDGRGPTLNIISPNVTVNDSIMHIRFNVSDISGVSSCWYNINNSVQNISINNCTNTTVSILNGNYLITMYSNDSFGFISSANKTFNVTDITPPTIISTSPSGDVGYTNEVTLTVTLNENSVCKYSENDESYASMNNQFSNTGLINTEDYDVQGGNNYEIYVKCADISNNINTQQKIINFTVDADEETGSSGGGGGSSTTSQPSTNAPSTSVNYNSHATLIIEATDNITFNINSENIALKYAFIKITGTKRNVEVTVIQHELATAPPTISSFDTNKQKYAFLELRHTNLDNAEINGVKLRFRVAKSWINDNYLDINSVKIYRYTDYWSEIPTIIYSQDNTGVIYEATSPGLSYFIIASNQNTPISPPVNEEPPNTYNDITGDNVLIQKDVEQDKPLNLNNDNKDNEDNKVSGISKPLIIIIVIAAVITIIATNIIIVKRKNAAKILQMNKEEYIDTLKKQYEFEGNQIIQEYNTRLRIIGRDPYAQQKAMQLKQLHDQKIKELHDKYAQLIEQAKNSK